MASSSPIAFFRVDANQRIGTGHLIRCSLLAAKLQEAGVRVLFFLADSSPQYEDWLKRKGFEILWIKKKEEGNASFLSNKMRNYCNGTGILIIDSDHPSYYSAKFQQGIRADGFFLMMITFRSDAEFFTDILHNQNLLALNQKYQVQPYTTCLLGPQYAILKDTFAELQEKTKGKDLSQVKKVLINFGGSDPAGQTIRTLKTIFSASFEELELIVVVGRLYNELSALKNLIQKYPANNVRLFINTPEMPQLMAEADLAITSGGLTAWELACTHTPNFLIPNSEREYLSAVEMHRLGLCYFIGRGRELPAVELMKTLKFIVKDHLGRREKVNAFSGLVDAKGAEKVVGRIFELLEKGSDF
jgi:UDP-2,4-diacetamido-2,4,6-trideoxy-beta-L-altropyranose hydrolase